MTDIRATSEAEVVNAVRGAREWKSPLNIVGNRTKRNFGRPVANWGTVLDVSGLKGIVDYRPEELIITVKPGTPVAEVTAALAEKNQRLGFDPPDLGLLFGAPANTGTIGGAISCDLAGTAAVRYGRARDHLLGIRGVNGHGEAFKAGGKVVKNVTGFDIPKLVCGAFGTLCVMTEVTLRVFPKPAREANFAIENVGLDDGFALLRKVWASPLEATGLALSGKTALIRLEGAAMPLEEKREALRVLLDKPEIEEVEGGLKAGFAAFGNDLDIWRITIPPSRAAALVRELNAQICHSDWAGGLIWAGMKNGDSVHNIAAKYDANAMLVRASDETRARISPFPPLSPERLALTHRVKAAFDPLGLFNPGRMYEGV